MEVGKNIGNLMIHGAPEGHVMVFGGEIAAQAFFRLNQAQGIAVDSHRNWGIVDTISGGVSLSPGVSAGGFVMIVEAPSIFYLDGFSVEFGFSIDAPLGVFGGFPVEIGAGREITVLIDGEERFRGSIYTFGVGVGTGGVDIFGQGSYTVLTYGYAVIPRVIIGPPFAQIQSVFEWANNLFSNDN